MKLNKLQAHTRTHARAHSAHFFFYPILMRNQQLAVEPPTSFPSRKHTRCVLQMLIPAKCTDELLNDYVHERGLLLLQPHEVPQRFLLFQHPGSHHKNRRKNQEEGRIFYFLISIIPGNDSLSTHLTFCFRALFLSYSIENMWCLGITSGSVKATNNIHFTEVHFTSCLHLKLTLSILW